MLLPSIALAELILRGSLIYLGIFALMRFSTKREAGTIGIPDLLLTVLIADAAQNAMASEYHSITEGAVLIGTLVFWNYALDWLSHHFPRIERLLHPPPLLLIKDGRLLRRNMRQELVTEEELMKQHLDNLRRKGLLPRLKNEQSICLLGWLFCLELCRCCLWTTATQATDALGCQPVTASAPTIALWSLFFPLPYASMRRTGLAGAGLVIASGIRYQTHFVASRRNSPCCKGACHASRAVPESGHRIS